MSWSRRSLITAMIWSWSCGRAIVCKLHVRRRNWPRSLSTSRMRQSRISVDFLDAKSNIYMRHRWMLADCESPRSVSIAMCHCHRCSTYCGIYITTPARMDYLLNRRRVERRAIAGKQKKGQIMHIIKCDYISIYFRCGRGAQVQRIRTAHTTDINTDLRIYIRILDGTLLTLAELECLRMRMRAIPYRGHAIPPE